MELRQLSPGETLTLPDDLLWADEHAWTPAVASTTYLITGALLVQSATRQAGRPITLVGPSDMAWVANPQPRTARQLMDGVLTINGVPLGWSIDWGLTDWNVPAGVFAHQGTWIDALAAIAEAPGGYLLPHPSEAILRVRHRYPVAPWNWHAVTPDLVLPVDAISRESLRWLEKPAYNRVFVSGQSAGVLGQVTRTGTAGNVIAPMVVDADPGQPRRLPGAASFLPTHRLRRTDWGRPCGARFRYQEPLHARWLGAARARGRRRPHSLQVPTH